MIIINTLVAALTLQQLMKAKRQMQPAASIRTLWRRMKKTRMMTMTMTILLLRVGCTQIPISTLSHIWVFVRLYGIVFVIIVIIIIIIMIIKSEGVNAQL